MDEGEVRLRPAPSDRQNPEMENQNQMSAETKPETLQKFVQGDMLRAEMAKVLPKNVSPERMARIAWTAIVSNPDLARCERNSLATAILRCCQAGLEPDGRNAHLVPFGNECKVIFDWKGLVALA